MAAASGSQYSRRVVLIASLCTGTFHFSGVLPLDKRTAGSACMGIVLKRVLKASQGSLAKALRLLLFF